MFISHSSLELELHRIVIYGHLTNLWSSEVKFFSHYTLYITCIHVHVYGHARTCTCTCTCTCRLLSLYNNNNNNMLL